MDSVGFYNLTYSHFFVIITLEIIRILAKQAEKESEMRQILLAVLALLLAVSIYVVFTSLQETGIFDEQNSSAITSDVPTTTDTVTNATTKTADKKPVHKVPTVTAKSKRLFLDKTIAAVTKVKKRLDAQYETVYQLSLKKHWTPAETRMINELKIKYKVEGIPCLLKRLRTHPVSIVLAQAALESGWGSSRFYREANNIFGIWSYNKNEPRMAAGVQRNGEKTVYVKKYPDLEASIEGYFRMMAKGHAYAQFRTMRLHTDNPFELIPYLDHYSELRHEYVKRLYYVIKSNKFYLLDDPKYQPPGWEKIKAADPKYLMSKKEKPEAKIADKCKKEEDDKLSDNPEDDESSHAVDLTVQDKTMPSAASAKIAHVTDLPHRHVPTKDSNTSKENNSSIKQPIKAPERNTAAL